MIYLGSFLTLRYIALKSSTYVGEGEVGDHYCMFVSILRSADHTRWLGIIGT
jgi:hypothetical protein